MQNVVFLNYNTFFRLSSCQLIVPFYSLLVLACSPSKKTNDCPKVPHATSDICFNSYKLIVSHFSFLPKFCGVWYIFLASSEILIFFFLHKSLIISDIFSVV